MAISLTFNQVVARSSRAGRTKKNNGLGASALGRFLLSRREVTTRAGCRQLEDQDPAKPWER